MSSTVPMVGASGAISGVLGAYIVALPARERARRAAAPVRFLHAARAGLVVLGIWFVASC